MRLIEQVFSRKTSSGKVISEIDGLRALAIFMVVYYHFYCYLKYNSIELVQKIPLWLQTILSHGNSGVPIFFTISGFILTLPFAKHILFQEKKVNLRSYLLRRITRLQPTYIIILFGISTYYILIGKFSTSTILTHAVASGFYIHNILYDSGSIINYVAWSLEIEFQFYLLLPLMAAVFYLSPLFRRLCLITLIMSAPLIQTYFHLSMLSLFGCYQYFLAGILCADFYLQREKHFNSYLTTTIIILVIASFFTLSMVDDITIIQQILYSLASFIIVYGVLNAQILKDTLSLTPFTTTGTISYTLYLIHFQLIAVLGSIIVLMYQKTNSLSLVMFLILISYIIIWTISGMAFLLIEKPFMNQKWYEPIVSKIMFLFKRTNK